MTNRFVKFVAAVAPAALLLAAGATPADAKVLLMGDGGWEVSFDGSVNSFAVWTSQDAVPVGTRSTSVNVPGNNDDSFRVRTGLLPAVWGMNVKAPTTGGLDMASRIGIYPNVSANGKNNRHNNADLDLREIFFTVDGSFGQVLVGKTLSQFMGKNIVTDMTLFGVGGVGLVKELGGTTLGRIGTGYVYPQFNARIQYTTPDMSGFKVSAGIYDPSNIAGGSNATATVINARETDSPRFEGEASYAGSVAGANVLGWINGLGQSANFVAGCGLAACTGDVTSWGFGGGLQVGIPVGPGTVSLMGSGYTGEALGLGFPIDAFLESGGLDVLGNERDAHGFIGQGEYSFGQGTKVGVSYGESMQDETASDTARRLALTAVEIDTQSLIVGMLSHDVNPNLKLVAEYGHEKVEWHDGADVDGDIFSVGAFFFW